MNESSIKLQSPPFPYYLECGKTLYKPGDEHPNRYAIGVFDLLLVTRGSLFIGEGDRQWAVGPGQTLILLPDLYHYSSKPCEEDTEFLWIHFQAAGPWKEVDSTEPTFSETLAISVPKYDSVRDTLHASGLIRQMMDISMQSRSIAMWEEQRLFWELLQGMADNRRAKHTTQARWLAERTESFLKQHYGEELTNEALSETLHFHPNYIARCMKEHYQCTPMVFLHNYRLERAKLLLLKTEWPISVIAESTGFRYVPYFSSCFKKKNGVSPLQFRHQYTNRA